MMEHFDALVTVVIFGSCSVEVTGFHFQLFGRGGNGPPLRGGTRGGGQQSIGGGMAHDAFATFNNLKFKPYNTFKVKCVG